MSDQEAQSSRYQSLPLEIHAATKTEHVLLNRLITARLPLCLPPHTRSTDLYTTGLSVFGSIYTAFEEEWQRILEEGSVRSDEADRIIRILESLHLPRLLRHDWLRNDLMLLESNNTLYRTMSENVLQSYRNAIMQPLRSNPIRIMAYTWVMYMALFNGGRWIRDRLVDAGPEFWRAGREGQVDLDCLMFWHLDSETDGNDIKDDFKQRFEHAATQLTDAERADVVRTAVGIFQVCHGMVEWLDEHAEDEARSLEMKTTSTKESAPLLQWTALAPVKAMLAVWDGVSTALGVLDRLWKHPGSVLETLNTRGMAAGLRTIREEANESE